MARRPAPELGARVRWWADALARADVEVVATAALAGGGTYAEQEMAWWALALRPGDPDAMAAALRRGVAAVLTAS